MPPKQVHFENTCGTFLGLDGRPDGTVSFHYVRAIQGQQPITSADVDALFVLVFGSKGPVWPSFTKRSFNPSWLAHTEMGKTIYVADQVIGGLFEDPGSCGVGVASLQLGFQGADHEIRDRHAASQHYLLRPEKIYRTWSELPDGTLRCQMHAVQMRVDAPGGGDPVAAGHHRPWDGTFAEHLTREFDRLAALWPVLERERQLLGMLSVIHELRERGFRPGVELGHGIRANSRFYWNL